MTTSYIKALLNWFGLTVRLLPAFLLFFSSTVVFGQQFQVDGKVFINTWGLKGELIQNNSLQFSLCVSNCCWEMTLKPLTNSGIDYIIFTCDGKQLYELADIETAVSEMVEKMKAAGKEIPSANKMNLADGCVVNSEVPHDLGADGAGEIWLMYASACYFKTMTANKLEVPFVFGAKTASVVGPNESILRQAFWTLQKSQPRLPENVSYLSERGEYTNGFYQVNSYTNYNGLKLPLESIFQIFVPSRITPNIYMMSRYVVKAEAFRSTSKPFTFPPRVPVLTTVADYRFNRQSNSLSKMSSFSYYVSNRFLTKEEATQTPYYAQVVLHSDSSSTPIRGKGSRLLILLIMGGTTLIFLTWAVRNMLNKNKKQ